MRGLPIVLVLDLTLCYTDLDGGRMQREKIALFMPTFAGGGAQRVMLTLADIFVRRGYRVDLVLANAVGPLKGDVPSRVRTVDLKSRRVIQSMIPLIRYLRREKPLALLSTLDHANAVAVAATRLSGIKTIPIVRVATTVSRNTAYSQGIVGRAMLYSIALAYRRACRVVAVSEGVREDLVEHLRVPQDRIQVIFNPTVTNDIFEKADEPLTHPWFSSGEPPVILGVGRLTKAKDFQTLIRAMTIVRKDTRARLIILGEGEERENLEALVKDLGLDDCVSLPGFVANPFPYIKRARVFVLSSQREGLPNVVIQALALGTRIVATDCPSGPREILEGGRWGQLTPVGDSVALALAIREALDGPPPERPTPEYLRSRYGPEAVGDAYLRLLPSRR